MEHRSFDGSGVVECRSGSRIGGVAMRYGDLAPLGRGVVEVFLPGAIRAAGKVPVNIRHRRDQVVALESRVSLHPDRVEFDAVVPEEVREAVRTGALRQASIEFDSIEERFDVKSFTRMIRSATLNGIALTDRPAYRGTSAEARARSGRTLRAKVPYNRRLACECIGDACDPHVEFSKEAGESMAEAVAGAGDRDVLAVYKDYGRPLGSARRGTMRARSADDGLEIEVDLPTGEAGDLAVSASEAAGLVARPLIDFARSEFTDTAGGRVYRRVFLRAMLIGATDAREGWPDAKIVYDGQEPREEIAPAPEKKKPRLWL